MLYRFSRAMFLVVGILMSFDPAFAQNQSDVLRYTRQFFPTNARAAGAANAFGAVGANSLAPTLNPAGLGLYRQSEASITPSLEITNTNTQYLGNSPDNNVLNFSISQFNVTLNNIETRLGKPETKGWAAYTFSLGLNRRRGFKRQYPGWFCRAC